MTPDTLTEIFNRLRHAKTVVYDVETSGLEWQKCAPVGHVLTFGPAPRDSFYVPVRHASGNIPGAKPLNDAHEWDGMPSDFERDMMYALNRPGLLVIGHNLAFDLKYWWRLGLRGPASIGEFDASFEDTMLNAALIDELQQKFSLDFCAGLAGVEAKKGDALYTHIKDLLQTDESGRDTMAHFWRMPGNDPLTVEYAKGDGTTTWQLRAWQMRRIYEQQLERVHEVESRLIPVLARMTCTGIQIDEERLTALEAEVSDRIDRLMKAFPPGFNVKSGLQVEQWCRDHGQMNWPLTPTGRPSFPEKWLVTHEAGRAIVAARKFSTLRSTFIGPMRATHMRNGRVYPEFNQLKSDEYGTVTGRLSSSNPNVQQIPKNNKELGRLFRSIFIPGAGQIWGSADYSQCEPRLLAVYSRCKVLLHDYRNNPDADSHTAVANASGLERHNAKQMNMALINGAGLNLMITKFGLEPDFAKEVWRKYFEACPEIADFRKEASAVMLKNGYVKTLLGRRCRLRDSSMNYVAVNRILQGGNADIIKWKMVQIDEYLRYVGRPVRIMANVHDALDYEFPEEARPIYNNCLKLMEDFSYGPFQLNIPMKVDAGEGRNWAIATYGEPEALAA